MKKQLWAIAFLILATSTSYAKDVWVYTSIYKEYIDMIKKEFEAKNPDLHLQVFQGGSEKIQSKVEAEIASSKVQADIVLTSDPFWSYSLAERGLVVPDKNGQTVVPNYYSLMVLVVPQSLPQDDRPKSFEDLNNPKYKNQVAMGSPLESGTAFSTVAYLSSKFGWEYFKKLRANDVLSHGGNSSVIQRIESGEKKVGIVLLENILASREKGSKIEAIYPKEGGVAIPSMQFILKGGGNNDGARKFGEFMISDAGQALVTKGFMYPANKKLPGPSTAKPFKDATNISRLWTESDMKKIGSQHKEIKKQFQTLVLD